MNDKEEMQLGMDLLFGVGSSGILLAALYLLFTVDTLGFDTLVYGLAVVVSAAATAGSLLLVRHRVTGWETTEAAIEELRSVISGSIVVIVLLFNIPNLWSRPWHPLMAVASVLFAVSATALLCGVIYQSVTATPERRHDSSEMN